MPYALDFGNMHVVGRSGDGTVLFHSPYQVDLEALCDIGQNGLGTLVPMSVKVEAKSGANQYAQENFINSGMRCGDPVPWPESFE